MKILLFSHRSDVDGITPVILSKLAFDSVDYILEEPSTINEKFKAIYEEGTLNNYDFIFVTDLCINHELAGQIEQDEKLKQKILIFDHHHTNNEMNQYSFITVIEEQLGHKECGSSLYYQYLLEVHPNEMLKKPVVGEMVELVRLIDTWEWKKENVIEATWIANLLGIYGVSYYIDFYYQFCLKEIHFFFDENQKYLLEVERIRIDNYIEKKEQEIIPVILNNYHIGIIFAELYRSELGNRIAEKYQDQYDFIAVVNISRSVSYRSVKEIDVSEFAKLYGGAGHKQAAGSSLPENLLNNIIKLIFIDGKKM